MLVVELRCDVLAPELDALIAIWSDYPMWVCQFLIRLSVIRSQLPQLKVVAHIQARDDTVPEIQFRDAGN